MRDRNEPMSVDDLKSIGLTHEEAISINKSQSYRPPEDAKKATEHAHQWHRYEDQMKGLDSDLSTGRINMDEYLEKQAQLSAKAYSNEL
ncbi:MAG TPA: hypothetical protein VLE44_01550 [Candidatus Saccharimonadales bacterium]|nr:hypothetical protein [Candidatus Saccharimonadales bacterium]